MSWRTGRPACLLTLARLCAVLASLSLCLSLHPPPFSSRLVPRCPRDQGHRSPRGQNLTTSLGGLELISPSGGTGWRLLVPLPGVGAAPLPAAPAAGSPDWAGAWGRCLRASSPLLRLPGRCGLMRSNRVLSFSFPSLPPSPPPPSVFVLQVWSFDWLDRGGSFLPQPNHCCERP